MQLSEIWKAGISDAIRSAPGTLFVCAAGNSNSNAGFVEQVPASLHLPNLMAVGAVDQAGDETSFTSYGETVVVDADGYNVESFVPRRNPGENVWNFYGVAERRESRR